MISDYLKYRNSPLISLNILNQFQLLNFWKFSIESTNYISLLAVKSVIEADISCQGVVLSLIMRMVSFYWK